MRERIASKYTTMRYSQLAYNRFRSIITSSPIAVSTLQTSPVYAFRVGIQAVSLILLGNLLGAEQFALFAAIAATALILGSCTNLGMNLLLVKKVSNDPKQQQEILSYALPSILLVGIVVLVGYVAIVLNIFNFRADQIEAVLAIGIAEIIAAPIITLVSAILLAAGRTWLSQLLLSLQISIRLAVLTLLLTVNIESPLYFYLCSYAPAAILAVILAHSTVSRAWPSISSWRPPRLSELKESTAFGSLNVLHIVTNEIDKTLIFKLIPATAAGMYVIGMRVIGAFILPITALFLSAMPRLFKKNRNNISLIKWLFFGTLTYGLIAAGTIWLGAGLIEPLFHNQFLGLEIIIKSMCLIIPGLVLKFSASNIFMTQRSAWYRVLFESINITLLTLLFIILSKIYGLPGAILAVTVTEWVMGLGGWSLILKKKLIQ